MSFPARRSLWTPALALSLGVLGCSGDDEGDAETTASTIGASDATAGPTTSDPATSSTAPTTAGPTTAGASAPETSVGGTATTTGLVTEEDFVEFAAGEIALGDAEQSRCLGQAVIDAIGYDEMVAAGVTPEDLAGAGDLDELGVPIDEADRVQLQDDIAQCGDLIEAAIVRSELNEVQADCLREVFNNDLIAENFVVELLGVEPSPELEEARTTVRACAEE